MIDRDRLLWELSESEAERDGTVPSNDELRAYRAGRLGDVEARRIEWRLALNAKARRRLVELCGARIGEPSERTRHIVLGQEGARRSFWQSIPWRSAALVAAVLIVAAVLRQARHEIELGPFDVRIEALAQTRASAGGTRALPQTVVRVVVESASDENVPGLHYALYRAEPGGLARVEAVVEEFRGGAILVSPAERLVGATPGTRKFCVSVARGRLPDSSPLGRPDPCAALAAATGGSAFAQELTILDPGSNGGVAW